MNGAGNSYRWSSYPAFLDRRKAPDWLDWETVVLEHATRLSTARRAYRKFVEAGMELRTPFPLSWGQAFCHASRLSCLE